MHVMVLGQLKGIFAKTGATIRKLFSQRCWCDWYQKCVNVIEDLVGLNVKVYICFIGALLKRCLRMVYICGYIYGL